MRPLKICYTLFLLFVANLFIAQSGLTPEEKAFIDRCDSLMVAHFRLLDTFAKDTIRPGSPYGTRDSIPNVDDATIKKRIKEMDKKSPFDFVANDVSMAMVRLYVNKRYRLTSRMLGLGQLYFPLFEEKLSAYHLPYELKYLPIVESALKPVATSPSGAGGLWQFMPATGRGYGLEISSMMDERNDPYMATEAACQYLSKLYAIYGDWSMSLAAYNAGQGTVNKAIRRAGGKTDYWSIRPFLPKETQNYVPAFIAVNYVMKYAPQHNIYPQLPEFFHYEMDTVHVSRRVDMGVVDAWTGYNRQKVAYLNPMYLTEVIPADSAKKLPLKLPVEMIGKFLEFEDSIYKYSTLEYKYWVANNQPARVEVIHIVKNGEDLASIAKKYYCTEQDIKAWNTSTRIVVRPGKKLVMFQPLKVPENYQNTYREQDQTTNDVAPKVITSDKPVITVPKPATTHTPKPTEGQYTYHVVQKGETLWSISKKYGTSIEDIKKLNNNVDISTLHAGTKLKVAKK